MLYYRIHLMFLLLLFLGLTGCVVAVAGGAATGAAVATDRRTAGTIVDDQSIQLKAMHALSQRSSLWKQSHITVVCYNNVLLLVGQTPTEAMRREAEEAMADIPKVRRIHNELTVENPISLAMRSKDSWITTHIKTKLIGSKEVSANRIKVVTENHVVYLLGLATVHEQSAATEIARAIPGVEKVVQIFEEVP